MAGLMRFGVYLVAEGVVDVTDGKALHPTASSPPESEETRSQGPSAEGQGLEVYWQLYVNNQASQR